MKPCKDSELPNRLDELIAVLKEVIADLKEYRKQLELARDEEDIKQFEMAFGKDYPLRFQVPYIF